MGFRHSEALPVGWLPDFWATISVIKHVNHKTLDTPMNSTVAHRPRSCPGILSTAFVFHRSSVHTMSHSSKSIFTWTTFIHCITCPISVRFGIICLGVWCHHHKITVDAGLSLRYNVITSKSTGSYTSFCLSSLLIQAIISSDSGPSQGTVRSKWEWVLAKMLPQPSFVSAALWLSPP